MTSHVMFPEMLFLGALLVAGIVALIVVSRDDEPEPPAESGRSAESIEDHWGRDEQGRKTRWDGGTFQPERGAE